MRCRQCRKIPGPGGPVARFRICRRGPGSWYTVQRSEDPTEDRRPHGRQAPEDLPEDPPENLQAPGPRITFQNDIFPMGPRSLCLPRSPPALCLPGSIARSLYTAVYIYKYRSPAAVPGPRGICSGPTHPRPRLAMDPQTIIETVPAAPRPGSPARDCRQTSPAGSHVCRQAPATDPRRPLLSPWLPGTLPHALPRLCRSPAPHLSPDPRPGGPSAGSPPAPRPLPAPAWVRAARICSVRRASQGSLGPCGRSPCPRAPSLGPLGPRPPRLHPSTIRFNISLTAPILRFVQSAPAFAKVLLSRAREMRLRRAHENASFFEFLFNFTHHARTYVQCLKTGNASKFMRGFPARGGGNGSAAGRILETKKSPTRVARDEIL